MEGFNTSINALPFSYIFTPNSSSSSNTSNGPWMDSRIWSRLPARLMDRVIAFLPPPAFFRSRSVCKRWYSLLFSNSFLQLYLQVSPRHNWFLFFKLNSNNKSNIIYRNTGYKNTTTNTGGGGGRKDDDGGGNSIHSSTRSNDCEGYLFDPYNIAWYRLSFALIPSCFSPASSSGGLICWISDEAGPKSLLLCNPLVGFLTQLPTTIRPRLFPSIGLTVTPTSIDVALAGDDLISPYAVKNLTSETFHMDGGGFYSIWGTTSSLPRLVSLESGQMVCVQGRFYCMNYSPFSVLAYDIGTNIWCKIQAPMRRFLRSPTLIECKGKLVLVAAVEKSKLNVPKSLRLWCLQSCGTTWVEMERMPHQLYLHFAGLEAGKGFDCIGHGHFIAIIIRGSSDKALLFDYCTKSWQWIPPCPFIHGAANTQQQQQDDYAELRGFAYEPTLATPVTALLHHLTLPF